MKPKISVIIPVYNAEKYLERCFESILANNYPNLEIIPINDGSTDNSWEVINKYKKKYPKLFYPVDQKNVGVGPTRNNGLNKATGKYIMFIDNDDFIDKDYFENHIKENIDDKYDVIISGYKRVSDDKELFRVVLSDTPWSTFVSIAPWGKLYKASFLKENNIKYIKTPISEDLYFNLRVDSSTDKIKTIPYIGYNWYFNNSSITNTISEKVKKIDLIEVLNNLYEAATISKKVDVKNSGIFSMYFFLVITQDLQWLSKSCNYKEISKHYDKFFKWYEERFPNYKKYNFWKLSRGDRTLVRLILVFMKTTRRLHLAKFFVWLYGRI